MADWMKTMSQTLRSLNDRVGMIEGAAASHAVYTAPPASCSTRVTGQVGAPTMPMETEMPPDVYDAIRAQVT